MEKLLLWGSKITQWFTSKDYSHWKTLFLVFSVLFVICATLFFEYDSTIFLFALVTSVGISVSLLEFVGLSTVRMESKRVALAWGCINYSIFITITSLFALKEEWGISHVIGLFLAFVCSVLLVVFCSYISYLLKLNDTKEDINLNSGHESKFNRCYFYSVFIVLSIMFVMGLEGKQLSTYYSDKEYQKKELLYQKQQWYNVSEWHTEILNGNTIYVIKCAKGRIGIYPSKYPQIRDINPKTQIKYFGGQIKDGLIFPEKLEIKN